MTKPKCQTNHTQDEHESLRYASNMYLVKLADQCEVAASLLFQREAFASECHRLSLLDRRVVR